MSNVYFKSIKSNTSLEEIQKLSKELLTTLIEKENITLQKTIPLKVHFGEKGNTTFIKSANFLGIIDFLKERAIASSYMETSVLYGGQRFKWDVHLQTALSHGFNQLPIIFADGEQGEEYVEVSINQKHFTSCKIGSKFLDYQQLIVISHFKGHQLAGFGGAIKQLAMGHASKGGKLAMHMGIKPHIINRKCVECHACQKRCNEAAITIGKKSFIDHTKCVGCGACVSACPEKAISIFTLEGIVNGLLKGNDFREKIVEYAYAAQLHKTNIYINFAMNITKGCDCEPKKMKPIMEDVGIFVSTDPVAIDKACYDMIKAKGKTFKGLKQLAYAEKIGVGSQQYVLIEE